MPRRSRSAGPSGFGLFLLGMVVGAGILVLYLACHRQPPEERTGATPPEPAHHGKSGRRRGLPPAGRRAEQEPPPAGAGSSGTAPGGELPADRPARVAVVIDDLGRSTDDLSPLERLGVPLTYAVLPFEENTPAVVAQLHHHGEEVLLHLPMEPKHGENPGPGALLEGMTDDQLRTRTLAALQAVPGAVGVNNHMGSMLSADARSMGTILRVISARGLFFLDSRTSPDSVGYRTAVALGIPAAERQVFLDPDPRPEAVHEQFRRLLDLARTRGAAVAIGHPHPDTLAVLSAEVPRARALGYDFVPVSYLLDKSNGPE